MAGPEFVEMLGGKLFAFQMIHVGVEIIVIFGLQGDFFLPPPFWRLHGILVGTLFVNFIYCGVQRFGFTCTV